MRDWTERLARLAQLLAQSDAPGFVVVSWVELLKYSNSCFVVVTSSGPFWRSHIRSAKQWVSSRTAFLHRRSDWNFSTTAVFKFDALMLRQITNVKGARVIILPRAALMESYHALEPACSPAGALSFKLYAKIYNLWEKRCRKADYMPHQLNTKLKLQIWLNVTDASNFPSH
jgi:hypothetical protein